MTNEDEELDIECDEQTLFGQAQYPFYADPRFRPFEVSVSNRYAVLDNVHMIFLSVLSGWPCHIGVPSM